jgi:hypothetical protein
MAGTTGSVDVSIPPVSGQAGVVGVAVAVGVTVGDEVGVRVGVAVGVNVGVKVGVTVGDEGGVEVGVATGKMRSKVITTPFKACEGNPDTDPRPAPLAVERVTSIRDSPGPNIGLNLKAYREKLPATVPGCLVKNLETDPLVTARSDTSNCNSASVKVRVMSSDSFIVGEAAEAQNATPTEPAAGIGDGVEVGVGVRTGVGVVVGVAVAVAVVGAVPGRMKVNAVDATAADSIPEMAPLPEP